LVGGLLVPHINKWDLESGFRSGSSSSSSSSLKNIISHLGFSFENQTQFQWNLSLT
jgi:hypothetical protein